MLQLFSILFIAPYFMMMSLMGGQEVYKVNKQNKVLEVGSFFKNWNSELTNDSETGINYSLTNDNQFLYVLMQIKDRKQAMMIARDGIIFTIKTKGKKGVEWSLEFPFSSNAADFLSPQEPSDFEPSGNNEPEKEWKPSPKEVSYFNNHFLTGMALMEISGSIGEEEPYVVHNKPKDGPEAVLSLDTTGVMYYESKIPLTVVFPNPEEFINNNNDNNFSFEFLVEPMGPPGSEDGRPPRGMEPPSGGGRPDGDRGGMSPNGGQRPGGGRGPGGDPNGNDMKTIRINVKKAALSNN